VPATAPDTVLQNAKIKIAIVPVGATHPLTRTSILLNFFLPDFNLHMLQKDKQILSQYFPEQVIDTVVTWIEQKKVHLRISRDRSTKLGDYRPPIRYGNHRISINHNLNTYAFLITFVHEYAHLLTWEKYERKAQPHGKEWKTAYRTLMTQIIQTGAFPDDIRIELEKSIINSKAASTSEIALSRMLKKYDSGIKNPLLEEIPDGSLFLIENGMLFKKGEKRRTRYKCMNMANKKYYLVHALTPVIQETETH
jgi:hypothetical protein